jgi:hypothetical protein
VILSAISRCYSNSVISPCYRAYPLCYSAQPFFTVLDHFMILLAIFYCYSAQPFLTATILSHFPVLQCSAILSRCSVIYDHVSHFRVARTGSGSREGTRLNCLRTHGSIGYARRTESRGTEPHVRWSRARHGVARARGVGSVARMSRSVWVDCWVQVMDLWSITLGDE